MGESTSEDPAEANTDTPKAVAVALSLLVNGIGLDKCIAFMPCNTMQNLSNTYQDHVLLVVT